MSRIPLAFIVQIGPTQQPPAGDEHQRVAQQQGESVDHRGGFRELLTLAWLTRR